MENLAKYNNQEAELSQSAKEKLKELNKLMESLDHTEKSLENTSEQEYEDRFTLRMFHVSSCVFNKIEFQEIKSVLISVFEKRKQKISSELVKFNITKNGL